MAIRGRLRVLLGAAPGVGKTYAMLEEGRHLLGEGKDVVIALVETHDRAPTAAMTAGLEIAPRMTVSYRGVERTEMDIDAVLARHPDVALVDELAHTNAAGSRHEKRWQDVDQLLGSGIDVISTVNVQHIESLNDVVQQITGVPQHETIPDEVLRTADQVEIIDLAPQSLRDRLSEGLVYPANRVDAALSNYFRLGNLTALRELALLWIADDVDEALQNYRAEHGIDSKWEARERVVVSLAGGPEGETLLRRGARIASRSAGGELVAVHVTTPDGLRDASPHALAAQQTLTEHLGGTYHQVVGDDVPTALVDFARSINATQLVIGVSRRSRLARVLTGPGIGATIIRQAGRIDVHIVNHDAAGGTSSLPRLGRALSPARRVAGFALTLLVGPLLTWLLVAYQSPDSITVDALTLQLLVVVVALVGGSWPALCAAVLSGLALDYFFIEPLHTVTIRQPHHLVSVLLYVIIAMLVSVIVDRAAQRARAAQRSASESELLQTISGSVLRGQDAVQALVEQTREAFAMTRVRLTRNGAELATSVREQPTRPPHSGDQQAPPPEHTVVPVDDHTQLELEGPEPDAATRRLLSVIAIQLAAALEHNELQQTTASDKVRTALLAAVSHDLRRPLASATAAISGLRAAGESLTDADRAELVDTASQSLTALAKLVTDLLDVTRLQAGALTVSTTPIEPADVILPALDEVEAGPDEVSLDVDPDTPAATADPVLLQRVLVNLLTNALRYRPLDTTVRLSCSAFAGTVEIRVSDHGPGVSAERRDDIFAPFQRLGDTDNTTGLGLGLALSKGFIEGMGGTLTPEDTPGGGLTMVISLPSASVSSQHPMIPAGLAAAVGSARLKKQRRGDADEDPHRR